MKADEYRKRKKMKPGYIVETPRYVTGVLNPHRRPARIPPSRRPVDDPETRGLTRDDE